MRIAIGRRGRLAIAVGGVLLILLIVVAMLPWGAFRGLAERRLSDRIGAPVHIGSMTRIGWFGFHPTVRLQDVTIAQPAWAGKGDLLQVRSADVRFGSFAALTGNFTILALHVDGARAALIRAKDGRANWHAKGGESGSNNGMRLSALTLTNAAFTYRDMLRDRRLDAQVAADAGGVRLAGNGSVRNSPVRVTAQGAPLRQATNGWPFAVRINGAALTMAVDGSMDRPFDTDHMNIDVTTSASDLRMVDAIIEAGLFGTQPVKLRAKAAHDGDRWTIKALRGAIGTSRLSDGHATVVRQGDRTRIDGAVDFATLRFDDLASNAGRAQAKAEAQRTGPRLLPVTQIDLKNVAHLDGALDVRVARLVGAADGTLRSVRGTLSLDHSRLRIDPVVVALAKGTLSGPMTIDQRGRDAPLLKFDLTLKDSSIATFGGAGDVDAPLQGYVRLAGSGETIRAALSHGDGVVALYGANGSLPAKLASFIGLDVGRGIFADKDSRAALRCLGMRVTFKNGIGNIDPLVIDTSRSQTRGYGLIRLSDEQLRAALYGAPKKNSILRLDKPIPITGTILNPEAHAPKGAKSIGSILGMLGDAITGHQPPLAKDVDCSALRRRVLAR